MNWDYAFIWQGGRPQAYLRYLQPEIPADAKAVSFEIIVQARRQLDFYIEPQLTEKVIPHWSRVLH